MSLATALRGTSLSGSGADGRRVDYDQLWHSSIYAYEALWPHWRRA